MQSKSLSHVARHSEYVVSLEKNPIFVPSLSYPRKPLQVGVASAARGSKIFVV